VRGVDLLKFVVKYERDLKFVDISIRRTPGREKKILKNYFPYPGVVEENRGRVLGGWRQTIREGSGFVLVCQGVSITNICGN
jgi:hypothetical protein